MNMVEVIGFLAGGLVMASFVPQVSKSWRTRSTHDIAISLSILNLSGQVLWLIYGFGINSLPLIIMSGITMILTGLLLILKLRFG